MEKHGPHAGLSKKGTGPGLVRQPIEKFEPLSDDFYRDANGKIVFTETKHIRRGFCCGGGCLHCPYDPKHTKGNTNLK